ncbi:MAG: YbaB/EbfC family nucleoid-associated protein [Planctomycetaceae bacterium]
MLNGLGNLASLMKQATQMQGLMGEMQEKLARIRVSGTAGGGMVQVEVSGQQKILSCTIDESLLKTGDQEMIEDLVVAAGNQAMDRSREAAAGEMNQLAGGLDLPGLSDAMSQFTGGDGTPS